MKHNKRKNKKQSYKPNLKKATYKTYNQKRKSSVNKKQQKPEKWSQVLKDKRIIISIILGLAGILATFIGGATILINNEKNDNSIVNTGDNNTNAINNGDGTQIINENNTINNNAYNFGSSDAVKKYFSLIEYDGTKDVEFDSAVNYYKNSKYEDAQEKIKVSVKNIENQRANPEPLSDKFWRHYVNVFMLSGSIALELSNPENLELAEDHLNTAISVYNREFDSGEEYEAFMYYPLSLVYFELGKYDLAIEQAEKVIKLLDGGGITLENRDTTLTLVFNLLGNCYNMKIQTNGYNDEWFKNARRNYLSAILTYCRPEIREKNKDFPYEVSRFTLGQDITGLEDKAIYMDIMFSDKLLNNANLMLDLSDKEKSVACLAFANLSLLYMIVGDEWNSLSRIISDEAIIIGKTLPISLQESLLYAYTNWFPAIGYEVLSIDKKGQYILTEEKKNKLLEYRDEADRNIIDARNIYNNLQTQPVAMAFSNVLFNSVGYYAMIGDSEESQALTLECRKVERSLYNFSEKSKTDNKTKNNVIPLIVLISGLVLITGTSMFIIMQVKKIKH